MSGQDSMQRANHVLESRARKVALTINAILFGHWDPIGVADFPGAPLDEYSTYAQAILGILVNGDRAAAIASYLVDVEEQYMGLAPNAERARSVAQQLVNAWEVRIGPSS